MDDDRYHLSGIHNNCSWGGECRLYSNSGSTNASNVNLAYEGATTGLDEPSSLVVYAMYKNASRCTPALGSTNPYDNANMHSGPRLFFLYDSPDFVRTHGIQPPCSYNCSDSQRASPATQVGPAKALCGTCGAARGGLAFGGRLSIDVTYNRLDSLHENPEVSAMLHDLYLSCPAFGNKLTSILTPAITPDGAGSAQCTVAGVPGFTTPPACVTGLRSSTSSTQVVAMTNPLQSYFRTLVNLRGASGIYQLDGPRNVLKTGGFGIRLWNASTSVQVDSLCSVPFLTLICSIVDPFE